MARSSTAAMQFMGNLADRYMQMKGLQFQRDLMLRREKRYDQQLQANRIHRQETRRIQERGIAAREQYYGGLTKRGGATGTLGFINQFYPEYTEPYIRKQAGLDREPEKYSTEYFEGLGYDPQEAKNLQDIQFGAAPRRRSPMEQVRDARMIMENALSEQEYQIGEQLLRDATGQLTEQRGGPAFKKPPGISTGKFLSDTQFAEQVGAGTYTTPAFLQENQFSGTMFESKPQFSEGERIERGGKSYRITGFDTDGEPLVELWQ